MKRKTGFLLLCVCLLAGGYFAYSRFAARTKPAMPDQRQTVRVASAHIESVPVYFQGIGVVTPPNTVVVKSRVDGQLMRLHFTEGQKVREGDLLAEIDPRPYEVQRNQAAGALARDEALLKDARLDLTRYRKLVKEQSVSRQQVQAQEALVGQYEGMVLSNKAAVADAELQLTYCNITAPISGRAGLKQVDVGNMIRASDATGIVIITQMQPMDVTFTLVEKQIPETLAAMRTGTPVFVEAWGQDSRQILATGKLLSLDNQIDTSTGTVKAKARFENQEGALFPNQFVNIRLLVKTLDDVLVVPTSAVQRNNKGLFVYTVTGGVATMQPVASSYTTADINVIDSGLQAGDIVVTDGVDRLRSGSLVSYDGMPELSPSSPKRSRPQ